MDDESLIPGKGLVNVDKHGNVNIPLSFEELQIILQLFFHSKALYLKEQRYADAVKDEKLSSNCQTLYDNATHFENLVMDHAQIGQVNTNVSN